MLGILVPLFKVKKIYLCECGKELDIPKIGMKRGFIRRCSACYLRVCNWKISNGFFHPYVNVRVWLKNVKREGRVYGECDVYRGF